MDTQIPTEYLLVTEVKSNKQHFENLISQWKNIDSSKESKWFVDADDYSVLQLRAVSNFEGLSAALLEATQLRENQHLISHCFSDFRQEILQFKENIIPQRTLLPSSSYLQMRHIEVPLERYNEYLQWRENTIFKHVKQLKTIDSFVAYHSLFSTLPGVMFVCGFSCEPEIYAAGFNNPAYKAIVQEAGNRFITGGEKGLYTKLYKAV